MKETFLAGLASLALLATPAIAQTTAPKSPGQTTTPRTMSECQGDWSKADRNKDGQLDNTEMKAAGNAVPATLSANASVTQADFMRACGGAGTTTGSTGGPTGSAGPLPGKTGGSLTK